MRSKIRLIAAFLLVAALAVPVLSPTPALAVDTTLDPNGPGSLTQLSRNGGSSNWGRCTKPSDADTSYVYHSSHTWEEDLFALTNPGLTGTINSVTVHIEAKCLSGDNDREGAATAIRTHSTDYLGSEEWLTTTYATYSTIYANNPNTTNAWTWTEINDLEAGVSLREVNDGMGTTVVRCTTVWVVVDYTAAAVPGITVSPTSGLGTTEGGGTDSFTVVLDTLPTADVTVGISSDDGSEGTASPASLTFGSGNWSAKQTVTVTGMDDDVDDGDIGYTINTAAASSSDGNYNGMIVDDVSVTNTDDDTAGITVNPTFGLVTTEGGGTDSFTVELDTQPTADVTVGISSDDTSEGTVSPTSLTFGTGNWSAPQTVTVTGVDDLLVDGDIAYNIVTAAAVSSDGNYTGKNPDDVSVTNNDDDTAGVTIVETAGSTDVDEEGPTSDTYSVELDSEPTEDVDISITPDAQVTVDPTALTFGSGNWSTPQNVTVTAVDDADIECPHTGTITHSASSGDVKYNGISIDDVIANIADNDGADLAVQMAMILDGSGSINSGEWDTMLDGLAAAVENVTCVPQDCSVELTVIQFSDDAELEVGPVVLTGANAADVADDIRDISQMGDYTCIACGICLAADVLHDHPDSHFSADIKQALNLVTDGEPNRCCNCTTDCTGWECTGSGSCNATASAEAAREYALNLLAMTDDQDEFDAEGIGITNSNRDWLKNNIIFPATGWSSPPETWPPSGPGWVRVVADADEFAETICEKFALVVQPCSITIVKDAVPDDSQAFNFTGDLGDFSLTDDGMVFNSTTFSRPAGTYNVTESVPACWNLTNISCTGNADVEIGHDACFDNDFHEGDDTVRITLSAGQSANCTFTDTKLVRMTIDKDVVTDPPVVDPGGQVIYQIVVANTNGGNATGVSIWDHLADGFTYVTTDDIIYTGAAERSSDEDDFGDPPKPRWGKFTIPSGGSVNITFTAHVGISVGPGTYENWAYAIGDCFDEIEDDPPVGQDPNTPPGEDPDPGDDEDVTIRGGPPPVGGEAYPVNKIAILVPWIALAALLAGGVGWFALRRRRARG